MVAEGVAGIVQMQLFLDWAIRHLHHLVKEIAAAAGNAVAVTIFMDVEVEEGGLGPQGVHALHVLGVLEVLVLMRTVLGDQLLDWAKMSLELFGLLGVELAGHI